MKLNLKFSLTDIFTDFSEISSILKEDFEKTPENAARKAKKLNKWIDDLENFILKHENIQLNLKPTLEMTLSIEFKNPNLISLALFRPSTRNLFLELEQYFQEAHPNNLILDKFDFMSELGDIAEGLALLGDCALDLAVTQELMEDGIMDKGKITVEKANIVQNLSLARLCDELNLYNNRIHLESKKSDAKETTIHHAKGTLVEAVIGVVYLEQGLESVIKILKMLKIKYF